LTQQDNTYLTNMKVDIEGVSADLLNETTVTEISMTESLLTPGLQTSIIIQSSLITDKLDGSTQGPSKNLDEYYGKNITVTAYRPVLDTMYNGQYKSTFIARQKLYRLSNRDRANYQVEQFQLDACDPSLVVDAKTYFNASYKSTTPSNVVRDVFGRNFPGINVNVEDSTPPRDYIATNIHPFQVISQQADFALAQNNVIDPSFVHFMTFQDINHQDLATHNFRSLTAMAKQDPIFEFTYGAKGAIDINYGNPVDIMTYMFPCDFDLISDVLNGLDDTTGQNFLKLSLFNPLNNKSSVYGGSGSWVPPWQYMSNLGTENEQNSTNIGAENYQLLRRARLSLLDQDKIALRMTVPFSPFLNVGRTINARFINSGNGTVNYGTGTYLIAAMTHNIKLGGMGTTTVDCVANTVAVGKV